MCYDVQAKLETLLKRAIRFHDIDGIMRIREELEPYYTNYYHSSGFIHQKFFIYQNNNPNIPSPAVWGLVPHWVKNQEQKIKLWNSTINARGETIFEKPSFRDAAKNKRCVLHVDGFFEHHYFKGKAYPFFISRKDGEPITIAGLWSEWLDKESGEILKTFSLVTTKANELMTKIHNNPKLKEARMPVILGNEEEEIWLNDVEKQEIEKLIKPFTEEVLNYHTVRRLRRKEAVGNVEAASEKYEYKELSVDF